MMGVNGNATCKNMSLNSKIMNNELVVVAAAVSLLCGADGKQKFFIFWQEPKLLNVDHNASQALGFCVAIQSVTMYLLCCCVDGSGAFW
jgi:hypothetical protein